ncbi:DUF3466 family protein [Moritella yayanosii]|uniref:GlyGly-CTERM sorting domain-containing protein n=1 Tax=Moritella yayanosii TaxID=69539 RepID=A0A330LMZ0_9GAMM|nr:DUF3466 family protein [Moritella yayanosii]SQD77218.1 conserved exported protein of unknown function, probably belong to Protein of unknown function DUF3466 [Moritella yayanosii]
MQLKKTKLAGIISLLLCSNAMAVEISEPPIALPTDGRFGPFVSAMDTSSAATRTAIYTNTFAQPFTYDIGAPWTYNEYCQYDDDVCKMLWEGTENGDGSDGLYVWRRNILNTYNGYNGTYESESETSVNGDDAVPSNLAQSRKITALDGSIELGYGTTAGNIVRSGFYGNAILSPAFVEKGGFSSAHDVAVVSLTKEGGNITFNKKVIVGQASVQWSNADDDSRFTYCFNYPIDDDRYDFDDLYNCPGFDLQASFWSVNGTDVDPVKYLTGKTTWLSTGSDATFIANAYAINTSGFAVGFSTQQIYSSTSGGRARATIFKPTVVLLNKLSYAMSEITKPKTDAGSDYNDVIRDTIAIDITDTVYVSSNVSFEPADGTDNGSQAFIVVGNRTFEAVQNRSRVTEFYTYDVASGTVRYPFKENPIKGATSQVSKINNDGLIVGWRDARGETSPREDGSARFQSAFIYDYKTQKSAYLDDLYCKEVNDGTISGDVRYRFANAISISDYNSADETYTIVANGFDYENVENYKNRSGSSPVVLTMTVSKTDLTSLSTTSQCPIKADEDYKRNGAGMGWFILLPTMMLLFRRFKH